jgi:hypothetical protein
MFKYIRLFFRYFKYGPYEQGYIPCHSNRRYQKDSLARRHIFNNTIEFRLRMPGPKGEDIWDWAPLPYDKWALFRVDKYQYPGPETMYYKTRTFLRRLNHFFIE